MDLGFNLTSKLDKVLDWTGRNVLALLVRIMVHT